jgi:hypothetical protein
MGASARVGAAVLLVTLVAASPRAATADLWDRLVGESLTEETVTSYAGDRSGLAWRGGAGVGLPATPGGDVLRLDATARRGCSVDFVSEFKAMFDAQAWETYFEGLIGAAISSAPLVLLCYVSPTLCDAYKHFKHLSSQILSLRSAECRAVEQAAMDTGTKMRRTQESRCIEERLADGLTGWQALDACQGSATTTVLNFSLQRVENLDLVNEALQRAGLSEEQQQLARAILGEIRFSGGGWQTQKPAPQAAEAAWGTTYQDYVTRLRNAVTTVRGGGTLGRGEIEALSVPGIALTETVFQRITVLPPPERELAVQKLASALTLARIEYLLQVTADELRVIAHEPENNNARELLEARIASLQAAAERVRTLRQHADRLAEAVTAIDQAARVHERRAWEATQPTPPTRLPGVGAPGRSPLLGGGLELTP